MKKKVISTVLCAAMVASMFAGCGNKAADNSSAADNSAADNSAAESTNNAAATETGDAADNAADNAETASDDAIANLIASTDGTVDIQLWCSELEAYQNVMKELTDKFKEQYSDVDFNITIGAVSEADAKDKILEDIDAAADVFVFADDQVNDLVNAGALQEVAATYTYDPK